MAFDKTLPIEGALAPTYNNIMRADKTALEAALSAYMYFKTGGTQTGQPRQGSSRPYFQASPPAARLDGDYFDSTDYGTPWIDSDDNALYILTSADGVGTDVWAAVSTEIIAVLLAAARTFAEIITFSKQPVFTMGIIDGEAYLVGRNAAGDANLNLLRTNASDLLELMDGAVLAAATETGDGDRTISDKAFVEATPHTGGVVQVVNTQTGAVNTGTTLIPYDDTIPQKTEGDEYMTLAITPTSATNKLKIEVVFYCSISNVLNDIAVALFQDTTANALAVGWTDWHHTSGHDTSLIVFTHYMTTGTTSETTFKVRAGGSASSTLTFNGQGGSRKYGGVMASSITITEIKV